MIGLRAGPMVIVLSMVPCSSVLGGEIQRYSREAAQEAGEALIGRVPSLGARLSALEADPSQSSGMREEGTGISVLVVPAAKLLADRDNPFLSQDRGLPVGLIEMRGVGVVGVDGEQLYPVAPENEASAPSWVGLLTVRRISTSEFRMELWGKSESPLAAVPFFVQRKAEPGTVDVTIRTGLIDLCWLGQYRAFLPFERITK